MEIVTHWQDDELIRYGSASKPVAFTIFVRHEQQVYPAENWNDYGAVMLRMWVREIARVLSGGSRIAEFFFLDGPYPLVGTLSSDGSSLRVKELEGKIKFDCVVEPSEIAWEIMRKADAIARALRRLNICKSDAEKLEAGLLQLQPLL